MGKSVALLSGKGGSGKTTLSLTIAYMFASYELKVLLVDCDLLTNGATYFFEDHLSGNKSIITFADMLYGSDSPQTLSPIEINPYLDFIPSICRLNDEQFFSYYENEPKERFSRHYHELSELYDVLLFDCPAGFSDTVQYVTSHMDNNLVVLEADTISMAAMRSLYIKLATVVPDVKFYQIFNKIRKEEADKYANREGSFFKNIGAITFDWAIPNSFALAQAPTFDRAGMDFGMQLYSICSELFRGERYQNKLQQFRRGLLLSSVKVERTKVEDDILKYKPERKSIKSIFERMDGIFPLAAALLGFTVMTTATDILSSRNSTSIIVVFTLLLVSAVLNIFLSVVSANRDDKERRMKLRVYSDRLREIDNTIEMLNTEIEAESSKPVPEESAIISS